MSRTCTEEVWVCNTISGFFSIKKVSCISRAGCSCLYRARDGRKDFVGLLQSWQDGDVVLEVGGQPMSFEKKEVAQVRLYPRF